jgi:hypothetical protein
VLALDRFGDFSVGSAVAPVRETAAQVLALLLATPMANTPTSPAQQPRPDPRGVLACVRKLVRQTQTWECRHGGFCALKYLVAVPSEVGPPAYSNMSSLLLKPPPPPPRQYVRSCWQELLGVALDGLADTSDDVREAACSSALSILRCAPPAQHQQQQALASALQASLSLLGQAEEPSAVHLPACTRLALLCLDSLPSLPALPSPPGPLFIRLAQLSAEVDAAVRSPVLRLCTLLLRRRWGSGQDGPPSALRELPPLHTWEAFVRLSLPVAPVEVLQELRGLYSALLTQQAQAAAPLCPVMADHVLQPEGQRALLGCGGLPEAMRGTEGHGGCGLCQRRAEGEGLDYGVRAEGARALGLLLAKCAGGAGQSIKLRTLEALRGASSAVVREMAASTLSGMLAAGAEGEDAVQALSHAVEEGGARMRMYDELQPMLRAHGVQLPIGGDEQGAAHAALEANDALREAATGWSRRVSAAAAAALAAMEPPDKPAPLFRALMESVKGEEERGRAAEAVAALVRLIEGLVSRGKARKAVEKVVGNLCALSCAPPDQVRRHRFSIGVRMCAASHATSA